MPIRVPSRLYRNRHGTFYFRLLVPVDLRPFVGQSELRLTLATELRQTAIIASLLLIADLPRMLAGLRAMADTEASPPTDFFALWRLQVLKNAQLSNQISMLRDELQDREFEIAGMVPRSKAREVVQRAYKAGQLTGKTQLEERLVFPPPPERTKLFSELVAAYLASFDYRASGGRKKPVGAKTLDGYTTDLQLFVKVMGDIRIGTIDRTIAGEYFGILRRLPPNMNRVAKYRDKTIPELLAMGDPPQSEVNASKRLERASSAFKWALEEKRKWGIDSNPFTGFGQSGEVKSARRPFTVDEMRALLSHPSYQSRQFDSPYSFWLIPLAVFTGARLGELAQLDLKDFVQVEGIPCIDINDIEAPDAEATEGTRRKRVKTRNAKRLVPIHPELMRMGLLRYVDAMRERKHVHLFPELSRTRRDGPSHAASNWFQRFRKKVGITSKQETVFHSFRHGFITNLLDSGITPHLLAPIVGHEAELVTGRIYWNVKDATMRKPTVDAFALPVEITSFFPEFDKCVIGQFTGRR